jgi:hypothetical protein
MYYGVDSWEEFDNALVLYESEKEEEYEWRDKWGV